MPYRPEYQRPPGWAKTRARVMRNHACVCHVCGRPGADEVDHVVNVKRWLDERRPGSPHDESNLRPIHSVPCHAAKTARERQTGIVKRSPKRRPTRNPNIID